MWSACTRVATVVATAAVCALSCQPSARAPALSAAPPSPIHYPILDLVGGWRWILRTEEAGTTRVEDERWQLRSAEGVPTRLVGRYTRTVDVASTDGRPFACNQRARYRQRAVYDVVVEPEARGGYAVRETGYRTEPGPCDHGFRRLGDYHAEVAGERLALRWPGGTQTLLRISDDGTSELPAAPWPDTVVPTGPWRWLATSYDDDGNVRDEAEWWEITARSDTRLDATYRRRVTVRSPTGAPITCANAPAWTYDDAYVLTGQREEEHWHFLEVAVDPADHPCLRATPLRHLDEATAEQLGDYFILEWRGKRRQILYRPDPRGSSRPSRRSPRSCGRRRTATATSRCSRA